MASDPESISSGKSFPSWLRTKSDNKFDLDHGAVSPPPHDDSFFYIRYPISGAGDKKQSATGLNSISEAISKFDKTNKQLTNTNGDKKNLVQHTEPCKQILNNKDRELTIANVKHPPKPFGTDDGFKGAGAACGSSIIKVAHQMVSAKTLGRGFTVASFNKDTEEVSPEYSVGENNKTHDTVTDLTVNDQMSQSSRLMIRRGSKSLPASPLGSPKTMRKSQNPYFTGAFAVAAAPNSSTENHSRGWFLSSLLGIQREATSSTTSVASHISEEVDESVTVPKKTTTNVGAPKVIKAKPSELREMNFWTPTSM